MSAYTPEVFNHDSYSYKTDMQRMADAREKIGETHIENETYGRVMSDWLRCTQFFITSFDYAPVLEKQLDRRDLDTVCAYELYQMKKHFVQGDALEFANFVKK